MHQYSLPFLYHMHHNRHLEDLPFWLDLAKNQGSPLLELGCGTGRILLPLVLSGVRAVGLDIDGQMLSFLKSQWPTDRFKPAVLQADMAHFHLATRFPLILLPCNTLSTLSQMKRVSLFECAAAHLSPRGRFAASLPNPALFFDLPARGESEEEDFFFSPIDGEPVQVSSAWERSEDIFTVIWHYDHLLPDGRVDRWTMRTNHCLTPVNVYLDELKRAGFEIMATYGDFDYSPYTPVSPNLIIVASL